MLFTHISKRDEELQELIMADVYLCEIIEKTILTDAVYSITVKHLELAQKSAAGQFLHIKCGEARILRRPISICSVKDDNIRFVFEVKGEGTRWLSECSAGEELDILGPLGNGFEMPDGKLVIVGGGVGTPPMLCAAESASARGTGVTAILGFRSADRVILTDEFEKVCDDVYITTDDGSAGIHGAVTKPLEELLEGGKCDAVMSCGQILMQKAVAELCTKYNIPCQVSLEERMGCGIGACLVCACAISGENGKEMSRACVDGPVYDSTCVLW